MPGQPVHWNWNILGITRYISTARISLQKYHIPFQKISWKTIYSFRIIWDSYNKWFLHYFQLLYRRAQRDTCTLRLSAWPSLSQLGLIADYCRCSHFRVTGNLKADVLAFIQLASWLVGEIWYCLSRGNHLHIICLQI